MLWVRQSLRGSRLPAVCICQLQERYAPGRGNACLQSMNTLQHVVLTSYTTSTRGAAWRRDPATERRPLINELRQRKDCKTCITRHAPSVDQWLPSGCDDDWADRQSRPDVRWLAGGSAIHLP